MPSGPSGCFFTDLEETTEPCCWGTENSTYSRSYESGVGGGLRSLNNSLLFHRVQSNKNSFVLFTQMSHRQHTPQLPHVQRIVSGVDAPDPVIGFPPSDESEGEA